MITFRNPRLSAIFADWPMGGNKRGVCTFRVEYKEGKGFRFVRQTTGKAKTATYGGLSAIVDGSDGRTYLLQMAGGFDFITVRQSDFLCADPQVLGYHHAVFPQDFNYAELKALILEAKAS
jgi:hypothetical protein